MEFDTVYMHWVPCHLTYRIEQMHLDIQIALLAHYEEERYEFHE
jgi:hypothetical protein